MRGQSPSQEQPAHGRCPAAVARQAVTSLRTMSQDPHGLVSVLVYAHSCVYTQACVYLCVCMHIVCFCVHMYVFVFVCAHARVLMCAHACLCLCSEDTSCTGLHTTLMTSSPRPYICKDLPLKSGRGLGLGDQQSFVGNAIQLICK